MASPREEAKESKEKSKGKGATARRFFRPYRKGGGKGKKSGKSSSSAAKANVADEEVEEEEIEDDALLADKRKRKRKPQAKKKGKPQPAGSAAHEAEAAVDDDGFAYSAVSYPLEIVAYDQEWCLKGAKGIQEEVEDGTSMILDTGCTKAMCSRHAYLLMRDKGYPETECNYCQTQVRSTSQMVRRLWRERSAEFGSPTNHLCSPTSQ